MAAHRAPSSQIRVANNLQPFQKGLAGVMRKYERNGIYERPDDSLRIDAIAIIKVAANNDARVAGHIGKQCSKCSQSNDEMGCTGTARDLIQSFCRSLLKFPSEDPLARIKAAAAYQ